MPKKDLQIILNGGIKSIKSGLRNIKEHNLDGFMIGREAYQNPFILSEVDNTIFQEKNFISRGEIAFKVAQYIDEYCNIFENEDYKIIRHILGLYNGMPGAKKWRTRLIKKDKYRINGDKVRFATDEIEELILNNRVA